MINSDYTMLDSNWRSAGSFPFRTINFNQRLMNDENSLNNVLRGCIKTVAKERSNSMIDDLRNFLALSMSKSVQFDLFIFNIMRGRDHGIPFYNQARREMGLTPLKTFFDIHTDTNVGTRLSKAYSSVEDVELYVGIISEKPLPGAALGSLGAAIVGKTFKTLREGDRLWYERVLNQEQLAQVRDTTLADIIQRNLDISGAPENVFKL